MRTDNPARGRLYLAYSSPAPMTAADPVPAGVRMGAAERVRYLAEFARARADARALRDAAARAALDQPPESA
jgi:plasmid replication initiation protein